jgi:hypothetical protein
MSNDSKIIAEIESLKRRTERLEVKEQPKAGMFNMDTYFDDLQMQVLGQKLENPGSRLTMNTTEGCLTFAANTTLSDFVIMNIQMSHGWKIGTVVYPHLHWLEEDKTNIPNWLISYRWQINGAAKTSSWTYQAWTSLASAPAVGLNQIAKFGDGISPPVGAGLSDILQIKLFRDTANASTKFKGADPLNDTASVWSFDIHYEKDQTGSDSEYVK